jgi:hypothetical protein
MRPGMKVLPVYTRAQNTARCELQQIDGGSTAELIPREQRVAAAIRVDQGDDAPR